MKWELRPFDSLVLRGMQSKLAGAAQQRELRWRLAAQGGGGVTIQQRRRLTVEALGNL